VRLAKSKCTHLIKHHIDPSEHQGIYDEFKQRADKQKLSSQAALAHLHKTLFGHDLKESADEEHHVSVFFGGVDPHTHMGHVSDIRKLHDQTPSKKLIFGMSRKGTSVFSDKEKKQIIRRQWGDNSITPTVADSLGHATRIAHDSLPPGKKVLHILVGADRESMGKNFANSLKAGKIREMGPDRFHRVEVHSAAGVRTHGMSGTSMRMAAKKGDAETYGKHLGPFSPDETRKIMIRTQKGLISGIIKVKR